MPKRNGQTGDELPDLDDTLDPALETDDDLEDVDESDEGDEPTDDDQVDHLSDDPDDGDEPADPPQRREDRQPDQRPTGRSRENDRVRSLREQVQERDRQLADTNRRLDELTNRLNSQSSPQETPEQRTTRLSLLTPEDRIREEVREATERNERNLRGMAFQLQDTSDRATFQAKATVDPLYRKWAPKVEEELATLRRNGQNVDRERLFAYMIGKAALEQRGSKESSQTRREAGRRLRKASTRPGNSRSDSAPQRETQRSSLEKRLENQPL